MDPGVAERRWWWYGVLGLALVAFVVRIGFVLAFENPLPYKGDGPFYHGAANLLADGRGFIHPLKLRSHIAAPAANHPPAYSVLLAGASVVGLRSSLAQQIWSCLLGAAMVLLVGIAGREIGGARVGLLAAAIAAIYPDFWINDGMLMSECLVQLLLAAVVLLTYRSLRRPTVGYAVALGAVCGLSALTRGELVFLLPFVVVPVGWAMRRRPGRFALVFVAASAAAMVLVIAPWSLYNQTRFEKPVIITTGFGGVLHVANCDRTYSGRLVGYWAYLCGGLPKADSGGDDSVLDGKYRQIAVRYVARHLGGVPFVVVARLGREFGLYRAEQTLQLGELEGRPLGPSQAGLVAYYLMVVAAVPGLVVLRRRRVAIWPLLSIVGLTAFTAVAIYGATRFRVTAEVALVFPAAVALAAATRSGVAARHQASTRDATSEA